MSGLGNKEIMAKNIRYYLDISGKSRKDICRDLNFSYSTFADWYNGNSYPRIDKIEMMANYFGISKSDLVENHDSLNTNRSDYFIPKEAIPLPSMKKIPIIGEINAGAPIYAYENIEGYDFADVSHPEEYFYLRVKGDSMINAKIYNGSLVLVHVQNYAENNQIVVCIVNGENATLKRYKDKGDNILLMPENPNYEPIILAKKDFSDDGYARIIGVAEEVKTKL